MATKPGIPESWKHVPLIGARKDTQPGGQPAEGLNFFGLPVPADFLSKHGDVVVRVNVFTCAGWRELYTDAPVMNEGGMVAIVQAFEQVPEKIGSDKLIIVMYKFVSLYNSAVQCYVVKPPVWWKSRAEANLTE